MIRCCQSATSCCAHIEQIDGHGGSVRYTLVNGRPPAEVDMQRFFQVTPPSVHQMVVALEHAG